MRTLEDLPEVQLVRALRYKLLVLVLTSGLCSVLGCARTVTRKTLPSAVISMDRDALDPAVVNAKLDPPLLAGEKDGDAYRVGPGDTVLVAVYGHPELSIAQYSGATTAASGQALRTAGLVVDNDGTIQFPLIGSVRVAGKDSGQLRQFLEVELARYIKDPKVTVQVAFAGSIRYYLLGEFTQPGLKFSDRPLNLLEALSLGGSIELAKASLRTSYVVRQGKRLPINFRRLLRDGDMRQNVRLRTGDVVVVPDNAGEQAFVFGGSTGSARGGPVPFRNGRLDLLQALAYAGFGYREASQGRLSRTHVIRSEGERGELYVVDAGKILRGEAAPFPLVPGDVVLVPKTAVTSFNLVLEQLLPTLQTVAGILNPFVQIKFLSE